ncbi:irditoxin subunit A [Acrasis kona]|uniref:Irditoxin subunit A n=1 Tax=Acrasis kona TaxID=1008807 RepID=A0AAW2ZI78_9EUKA
MSSSNKLQKWGYQLYRRVERWVSFQPEYHDHLPETQYDYRDKYHTSGLTPEQFEKEVKIPRSSFIKDFHVRYYRHDFRLGGAGQEGMHQFKIIWRDEIIEKPDQLLQGQTVGPFYSFGLEDKSVTGFDLSHDTQVYSYSKSKQHFRPDDRPEQNLQQYQEEEERKVEEMTEKFPRKKGVSRTL